MCAVLRYLVVMQTAAWICVLLHIARGTAERPAPIPLRAAGAVAGAASIAWAHWLIAGR